MTLTVSELSGQAEELLDQARELAVAWGHALEAAIGEG
jgi:hypothetical protein